MHGTSWFSSRWMNSQQCCWISDREEPMTMTDRSRSDTLDQRETAALIGSDKVEGTAVYGSDGERIGSVKRIMIDKISGKVTYAVMSFGGFLGMGEDYYPVPWS